MNPFYIIAITLVVYSMIATILYLIFDKESILQTFGLGVFGIVFWAVAGIIIKIITYVRCINRRSIFKDKKTKKLYKCKIRDTNDVLWDDRYEIVKRYAKISDWESLPDFSKDFIEKVKRNCDHCKYFDECIFDHPYNVNIRCKHSDHGEVLEFDKFERKGRLKWK